MNPLRCLHHRSLVLAIVLFGCAGETKSAETQSAEQSAITVKQKLAGLPLPPRLFANDATWRALPARIKSDPVTAAIYRATRQRAEAALASPLLVHEKEGSRQLTVARLFLGRMLDLATVARVENDDRFAQSARQELLAVARLRDWNPQHFLDVGEYALGAAIGLDWLHDRLTQEERDMVASALVNRAIKASFKEQRHPWIAGKSNWTQVCHAGLAAAAIVVAEREPELAVRTIARAINAQAGPAEAYAPDGAYAEGPMYWGYGTAFHVILATILQSALGQDFGVTDYPGFLASADYIAHARAPSGRYFNYSDARELVGPEPALHWFAARSGRPGLARAELQRLDGKGEAVEDGSVQRQRERLDALALWWRDPSAFSKATTDVLPPAWIGRGENPIAVFRSAWDDARAVYLGIKGGTPGSSHAHMDAGSFVIEANGVRWAVDPGMQDYHSLESAGVELWNMQQRSERWQVFRLGPNGHNIVRFNGAEQLVEGAARFTSFSPTEGVVLNLTPLYADDVRELRRTAELRPDGSIQITDEWRAGKRALNATWQWLTYADVEATPEGAVLRQDGQRLHLRVRSPRNWTLALVDCAAELKPFDAPTPGLKRIEIRLATSAGESGSIRVEAAASQR